MNTALVSVESQHPMTGMLMPLATPTEAAAAIAAYEALKAAIVRDDDIQVIQGRKFLKKSFWRRVATCFGLSLELVREERIVQDGHLAYRVMYRAIAPNGRTMDSDGYCSTAEPGRGGWPEHNVRATAHTRAKNRAISDLVGGGEVSAEELPESDGTHATPAQHPRGKSTPAADNDVMWQEVGRLAGLLGLTQTQKTTLFRVHKRDATVIYNNLREMWNKARAEHASAPTVDADEPDVTFEVESDHSLEGLEVAGKN